MKVEPLVDRFERRAFTISFEESSPFTEVYGFVGRTGRTFLQGELLLPDRPSETLLLFMHPSSALGLLPLPAALAESGHHVMCGGSRYLRNDSALIMEKVAIDMGAYVRHAKTTLGYRHVVLMGWSGGGSLSVFYQSQAESPTIRSTPAGDPVDLVAADLMPADAVMSIAAHLSRAESLTEWLDPSVLDENDPDLRDLDLDIYAEAPRHEAPFETAFVTRFREAQVQRNRRITARVEALLDHFRSLGQDRAERAFVVHRTMCDVRWLDPGIDPNGRKPNWSYLGDPRVVNMGPAGLARFTTLRAWLSQWSIDRTNTRTSDTAPKITVPALVIENGADDATPSSHPKKIFELIGSDDKSFACIEGASHYYQQQPEKQREVVNLCETWLKDRGFE